MTEVYITNVSMGDAAGTKRPEIVSLNFSKIKYTYKQQSETGGDQATPFFEVDVKSGKVTKSSRGPLDPVRRQADGV